MKMKNINLSFLVLLFLLALTFSFYAVAENSTNTKSIFLDSDQDGLSDEEEKIYGTDPQNRDTDGDSYSDGIEVKSGYNPTIPAPGDRIMENEKNTNNESSYESEENLTQKMAEKISILSSSKDSEDQEITLEETQAIVDEILESSSEINEDDMPEINTDDIKIKKQNYGKLSKERQIEKKKEDFTNYIIAIYYIFSSNSDKPITSGSDISNFFTEPTNQIISAISTGNTDSIKEFAENSEKIIEQMKEVEVPEDLIDLHIKGLRFAHYSLSIKNSIKTKTDDPLSQIVFYGKVQALIGEISNYSTEITSKFNEYELEYDDDIKKKIEAIGLFAPEKDFKINPDK